MLLSVGGKDKLHCSQARSISKIHFSWNQSAKLQYLGCSR